jgi:hypothetical protein
VFIFFGGRLEMGWEFIVHGGESYLLDEGIEPLFLGGAADRLGLGYGERSGAVGHTTITLRKYA